VQVSVGTKPEVLALPKPGTSPTDLKLESEEPLYVHFVLPPHLSGRMLLIINSINRLALVMDKAGFYSTATPVTGRGGP
jgi:hypothetical protein